MNYYYTKLTATRYGLELDDTPQTSNQENMNLFSWGVKIVYIQGKKSLQVLHYASKFTVLMFNISKRDMASFDGLFKSYLDMIFLEDPLMRNALKNYFEEADMGYDYPLKDKSIIARLNKNQTNYFDDMDWIFNFVQDDMLYFDDLCLNLNQHNLTRETIDGNVVYTAPLEDFRALILDRYDTYEPTVLH